MPGGQGTDDATRRDVLPGPAPAAAVGVSRTVVVLAVVGTILLALGAFWLSFTTLRDLAVLSGIPAEQAWVWPLIVDGVILEATISVVALRNSAAAARRFAWLLLACGAGVSVAANITHAVVAADARVPGLVAALVASVPPVVLLAMTHLTVELTRNTTPTATGAATDHPDEGSSEPPAEPVPAEHGLDSSGAAATRRRVSGSANRQQAQQRALEMYAEDVSMRQIAAELGVHPTTVSRWVNAPDRRQDGAPR